LTRMNSSQAGERGVGLAARGRPAGACLRVG